MLIGRKIYIPEKEKQIPDFFSSSRDKQDFVSIIYIYICKTLEMERI